MFRLLFVVAFVPALVLSTPFNPCEGPGMASPTFLEISDCDEPPCRLIRNGHVDVFNGFAHHEEIEQIQAIVIATAFGVTTHYPLPAEQADVCGRLIVGECPLDANEDAIYHMMMPILEEYPITPLTIQVQLQRIDNGKNETISCFWVDAVTVLN